MKLYELNTILNFGKYEGETVENIIKQDNQYIGWCISEVESFYITDTVYEKFIFYDFKPSILQGIASGELIDNTEGIIFWKYHSPRRVMFINKRAAYEKYKTGNDKTTRKIEKGIQLHKELLQRRWDNLSSDEKEEIETKRMEYEKKRKKYPEKKKDSQTKHILEDEDDYDHYDYTHSHDSTYYNDALDMDQQSPEFWDSL